MKRFLPRTIFLQQNVDKKWFVRTGASNGKKISTEEDFSDRTEAREAFIREGRHQPYAHMVIIREGFRPETIRAGSQPAHDHAAEELLRERIADAFARRPVS